MGLLSVVGAVVSPITGLLTKKQEVREARQAAMGALAAAQQEDATHITLEAQAYETVLAQGMQNSYKDEYITISLVGIINAIVLGGILQGFGYPQFMEGVLLGVTALSELIDLRFCMTAVIMSGIGLSVWRKI